ncbi:MAG: DUF4037 domain-containing protein [Lachnospiraceae bacterium]|nr:DUF4037 domain-containing protein [Lachnospiraceae bacterium]
MYFVKLWNAFASLPEVEAIALGGSRASSNYDKKSDYDLYIYCKTIPEESVRISILEQCCQYMEIGNSFWELEDDCTLKDGIDIDILYRNIDSFAQDISSVVEKHIAHNGYTTCMWHNLLNSQILYDESGRFEALQKRFNVSYPAELKSNIIKQNMRLLTGNLPSYDFQIKKAVGRGDLVSVNHRTAAFLESYFDIIFAMNEMTHPGEKRMVKYALSGTTRPGCVTDANTSNCLPSILPANFEANLNTLFADLFGDPKKVESDIQCIIDELQKVLD